MKKKRGISPLVSWVLLIGFVVGISLMVTTWVKSQAETTTDKVVTGVESDLRCADVSLNAVLNCGASPEQLNITNTGKFTIAEIRVRQPNNVQDHVLNLRLKRYKTEDLNNFDPSVEADVIPSIIIEGKKVVCSARKVVVKC